SAIMAANASSGSDTISLPAGSYNLSLAGANEDADASGDLDIKSDLTITGVGAVVIDAKSLDRVFQVFAGFNVTVAGVTIRGGHGAEQGGGVFNAGTLTLTGNTITNNAAMGDNGAGGTTGEAGGQGGDAQGGAIYNDSGASLTILDTSIYGNE